jgi:hypothetical protein
LIAALEEIRQLAVVQAQELQDRRVQVVDVDGVFDGPEAELVGGPERAAPLDPGACQGDTSSRRARRCFLVRGSPLNSMSG